MWRKKKKPRRSRIQGKRGLNTNLKKTMKKPCLKITSRVRQKLVTKTVKEPGTGGKKRGEVPKFGRVGRRTRIQLARTKKKEKIIAQEERERLKGSNSTQIKTNRLGVGRAERGGTKKGKWTR